MAFFQGKLFQVRSVGIDQRYSEQFFEQRCRDLINRQLPGVVFYPLSWAFISVAIIYSQSTFEHLPILISWFLIFILVALLRYLNLRWYKHSFAKSKKVSLKSLFFSLFISAGSWGVMVAVSLVDPLLSEYLIIILAATFALCGGGVISLSICRQLVIIFLSCMLLPLLLAILLFDSELGVEFFVLVIFYFISMYGVSIFPKREYELMVIANIKLSEQAVQLSELTMQDGLTGIHNRRYFNEVFSTEISRASRLNYSLVLLMIDVDHFKRVNDEFGHLVGDDCLIKVAQLIKSNIHRKTDIFARYGGEEFALVLTNISKDDGVKYAEELRETIEEADFQGGMPPLTISIGGVSLVPNKETSTNIIVAAADKALYQSKTQGRNYVTWVEW